MSRIEKPGIYVDFDEAAYHRDPCVTPSLNQSLVKVLLDRSPAHAKLEHPRLTVIDPDDEADEKYDKAKAIGNAAHAILIGRGRKIIEANYDNWQTKEARNLRREALRVGNIPVLSKHMAQAQALVSAVKAQCVATGWPDAFTEGNGEVVLAWQEDGIWFRALVDWLNSSTLTVYDLKSSGMSCAPHVVGRLGADAGWDIQAAFIERGLNALLPESAGRWKFRFLAVENEPPFAMSPVELSEHWLTMGRKKIDHVLPLWRQCLKTNRWPAYDADPLTPEYPGWKESQWLVREETEAPRRPRSREPMLTDISGG